MLSGKGVRKTAAITAAVILVLAALVWLIADKTDLKRSQQTYSGITLANEEELVKNIRHGLKGHASKITVTFRAYTDDLDTVGGIVRGLMDKAMEDTGDPKEGDYIRFQTGGYEVRYINENKGRKYEYTVKIIPDYYTYLEWENTVDEKVDALMRDFAFDGNTSDYAKVKTIYDYVCANVSYDKVHKKNENNHLKTTAYSALVYRTAVCQGYAVLLYRLFKEAGVDSRIITGTALYEEEQEYHAWNIVNIDGRYYNLDATWDTSMDNNDHFLKCDAGFSDHIRTEEYDSAEFRSRYVMAEKDYEEN